MTKTKNNTKSKTPRLTRGNYRIVPGVLSKSKLACLWEKGGGDAQPTQKTPVTSGKATLIAKPDGTEPTAIYINDDHHRANSLQALVPIYTGYFVVRTVLKDGKFTHEVFCVIRTWINWEHKTCTITLRRVCKYQEGVWDTPLPDKLCDVVNAAEDKVQMHLCRIPMFVVPSEAAKKKETKEEGKK